MRYDLRKKAVAFVMTVLIMLLAVAPTTFSVQAASTRTVVTTMECSVWSAPNTADQNRVKKIPAGYSVTVYTTPVQSTAGDGKVFYKTVKGRYILCKCFGESATLYDGKYGSVGNLSGKTLIVSLFASDAKTNWKNSGSVKNDYLSHLGIAVDWITEQCARYGVSSEFLYDWQVYPDLAYSVSFSGNIDDAGYYTYRDKVLATCNKDALLEKYHAQNIMFIIVDNTDANTSRHNYTYMSTPDWYAEIELVRVHTVVNYGTGVGYLLPSSIAHEILHTFGAPDLYSKNETIPQAYVTHLEQIHCKDIMYTTNYGNDIFSSITEISAYYLGLTNSLADVSLYSLGKTEKAY